MNAQPLVWQIATLTETRQETPEVKSLTFSLPDWMPHQAGQHYDIRLTAADGYQTQRSYSIASEPMRTGVVELTVEKITDGEVSPYLDEVLVPGDKVELRGPIGGFFVWEASLGGPLLLIGGGSGVVPLRAMLRHRAAAGSRVPTALIHSSKSREDAIYFAELQALAAADATLKFFPTLTRSQPPGWTGYSRRIDQAMLTEVLPTVGTTARVYICGPTLLVEAASETLVDLGLAPSQIRTERFGPTGP